MESKSFIAVFRNGMGRSKQTLVFWLCKAGMGSKYLVPFLHHKDGELQTLTVCFLLHQGVEIETTTSFVGKTAMGESKHLVPFLHHKDGELQTLTVCFAQRVGGEIETTTSFCLAERGMGDRNTY